MRIRLTGSAAECQAAATLIASVLRIRDEYLAYQHRPTDHLVRMFLDAEIPTEQRKEVHS